MAKRFVASALVLVLVLAAGAFGAFLARDSGQEAVAQTGESDRRTVSVSGQGQVAVEPDTGHFTVGVEVSNESADVALDESNALIEQVTAALIGLGIAEDDITLSSFSIWPEYDYRDETPELRGFRASHQLSVKVRNIDQTGEALTTAINAGANVVHGVGFSVEDPAAALDQARERAFADARHKAEELARLSGGSLGAIVSVSETSYTPVPIGRPAEEGAGGADSAVPINPGESTFSVDIQVVWELV
jgi:uncharacterized protein YggE